MAQTGPNHAAGGGNTEPSGDVMRLDPAALPERAGLREGLISAAPAVRRYLFGMCGDWDVAEDLAQEALLKAWAGRAGFDGRASARTWVFAIARNHWIDRLRRRKAGVKEEQICETFVAPAAAESPLAAARRGELAEALARAMGWLPPEQREAIAMRESEGLTFREMAATLGIPVATAKSRVRYALMKLAEELEPFRQELES